MELWDFPNGNKPLEHLENTLAEETRLITRDIVAITRNLDDAYDGNDIRQTLNYLATADNGNLQFAYNIMKQLVESHLHLEYQLNKANRKIEHQQQVIQEIQPELASYEESDYESEYESEVEEEDNVITTNIPFFANPPAPAQERVQVVPTTPDSSFEPEINEQSSDGEQDEIMDKYQNLMFEDDFAFKPRLIRNNSQGTSNGMHNADAQSPVGTPRNKHKYQKRLRRKYEETVKEAPTQQHMMKKLARVKSNPNARRFRQKKSYLTRREQWNMEFPSGSPKLNDGLASGSNPTHKSSISLDSTALGLSMRPILDMNRNVPIVVSSKRTSPDSKNADSR